MLIADGQAAGKARGAGLGARDRWGLALVGAWTAGLIAYRAVYIEPRAWGAACAAAAPPLACVPRSGVIWMQGHGLWGAISLGCGLFGFFARFGFGAQLAAILFGVAGVENYNATWGAAGAALGAWGWLRRQGWAGERSVSR